MGFIYKRIKLVIDTLMANKKMAEYSIINDENQIQ